jgi:tRNA pseudouridine55 synthase
MNGVLVIDKPQGLTSHDVVAAARRALGETKIGHTGTLDPLATGVLPLAIGRATRLVRFLAASDKDYEATIRFGLATDTYDVTGHELGRTDAVPSRDELMRGLDALTGEYVQTPPPYSAKKVDGRRAYQLARADQEVTLAPVPVRVTRTELLDFSGPTAHVALTCSAGFYVRSFAATLGEMTRTGACLEALRRTRSGDFALQSALHVEELGDARRVAACLVPLSGLLTHFPAVTVTSRGLEHVSHGRELTPADYEPASPPPPLPLSPDLWVRVLDAGGGLGAIAVPGSQPGSLHPAVVLM